MDAGRFGNPVLALVFAAGLDCVAKPVDDACIARGRGKINRVSINDLHATILHLLGMDHTKLTYRFNGRDFRLTDVAGEVVKGILA